MDRASDSGSEGWGFESLPVYQKEDDHSVVLFLVHREIPELRIGITLWDKYVF